MIIRKSKRQTIVFTLKVILVAITINLSLGLLNVFADEVSNDPIVDFYSEDYKIRLKAVKQLGEIKPMNEEVVSLLAEALNDKSDSVKIEALRAITSLDSEAKEAFPNINSIIKNNSVKDVVRRSFLLALPKFKNNSSFFVPALIEVLEDVDTPNDLKVQTMNILSEFGDSSDEVISVLETLADESENFVIQYKAWESIAVLEPNNKNAITKLVEYARDKNAEKLSVHTNAPRGPYFFPSLALHTLVKIEEYKLVLPIIIDNLYSNNDELRGTSAGLVQKVGKDGIEYIPQIIEALKSEPLKSDNFRIYVIGALVRIDPNSELVRETLEEIASRDPEPGIRKYAGRFLTSYKVIERNPEAIGELINEFNQTDILFHKLDAAAALSRYGPEYDEYWDYLYQAAKASIEEKIPFPGVYDENSVLLLSDKLSDKFVEWCNANNCDEKKVSKEIMHNSTPVFFLSLTADKRAYNLLLNGLESDNFKIVSDSINGLVYINDTNSVDPILRAIKNLPHGMQKRVGKRLNKIENEVAQTVYEQLVQDMDEEETTDENSDLRPD